MFIYEGAARNVMSFISIDLATHQIKLADTKNSDYPTDQESMDSRPTSTPQIYYLHASVNNSDFDKLFYEIPFYVVFTLNCDSAVTPLVGQTLEVKSE